MKRQVWVVLAVAVLGVAPVRPPGRPPPFDIARILSDEKAPGAQVLVLDHGRVVYEQSFGVCDLTTGHRVDVHTRFEIGSVTKQFTAAAILQLCERGKLSLSDTLEKFVPQYRLGRQITLEQLLRQVSGISNYMDSPAYWKHDLLWRSGTPDRPGRTGEDRRPATKGFDELPRDGGKIVAVIATDAGTTPPPTSVQSG